MLYTHLGETGASFINSAVLDLSKPATVHSLSPTSSSAISHNLLDVHRALA
ncbi:hypothetical protein EXN66_Car006083 [Channa argus]|uniref:Uncharacterized protein n=1 Tax=Channa argus TaxID=215402 RepID=A0A6G1PJD6_CHAAH|nr:hypothetical protein EXN66_Car006083 [Channa argus]